MATFADNFNRADGALGSNWASVGTRSQPSIIGNQYYGLGAPGTRAAAVATSAATFTADHEATITMAVVAANDFAGPCVRLDTTNGTGYIITTDGTNSSNRRIHRITNAGLTNIGLANITCVAGDTITLRVVGTTLTAYKNGSLVDTVTDATYSSGQPGLFYDRQNNGSTRGDDFTATDIGGQSNATRSAFYHLHGMR